MNRPQFLAAGQQGCVYDGEFEAIQRKDDGCDVISSPASMRNITKIIASEDAYKNELNAARVLVRNDPGMSVAVYATRGCTIQIQDILTEPEVDACNKGTEEGSSRGTNEKMPTSGTGYSIEMPYVEHIPLKKYETRISVEKGKRWFKELKDKINKLHEWGIYHNDLHYGNVWVVGDSLKIADFGLAIVAEAKNGIYAMKDIKTSAPSFAKIWALVHEDERYGSMIPSHVLSEIDRNGIFVNPDKAPAESSHKRLRYEGSPLGFSLGLRFGNPEGIPPAPSSAAKRPTARSLFD